jgi:hypothetical protein
MECTKQKMAKSNHQWFNIVRKRIHQSGDKKITINLDNDLSKNHNLIKKVLCIFIDKCGVPISLPETTSVTFHTLLELHAGHHFHNYNYHLGKKKHYFTEKKHEEEGLQRNDFVWILDFGWTMHDDNMRDSSNHMEFTYHFTEHKEMEMIMLVIYEDDDHAKFEFGWLQDKLIAIRNNPVCSQTYIDATIFIEKLKVCL